MSAPAARSAAALGGSAGEPICHSGGGRAHDCRQGAGVLSPEPFGPRTCSANAKWLRGSEGPLPRTGRLSPVRHESGEAESRQTLTCTSARSAPQRGQGRPAVRSGGRGRGRLRPSLHCQQPPSGFLGRAERGWERGWGVGAAVPLRPILKGQALSKLPVAGDCGRPTSPLTPGAPCPRLTLLRL